jgi:hypothetical protein
LVGCEIHIISNSTRLLSLVLIIHVQLGGLAQLLFKGIIIMSRYIQTRHDIMEFMHMVVSNKGIKTDTG